VHAFGVGDSLITGKYQGAVVFEATADVHVVP